MEDLDTPRVVPGCAAEILRVLAGFALEWDGEVEYQSRRTERYTAALAALEERGLTFRCSCSRRELAGLEVSGYPGSCRHGPQRPGPTAVRFRIDERARVRFEDRIQGPCEFALRELGDFVIRRRDGVFSYQLAVVVDDCAQGVTHVVRGVDLLDCTPWQIVLAAALGADPPRYAHLPLVVEPDGRKLAKSRRSVPLDASQASGWLVRALRLLGLDPPVSLSGEPPRVCLAWALAHWQWAQLAGRPTVPADLGPHSGL